jgi:hypothetical protein
MVKQKSLLGKHKNKNLLENKHEIKKKKQKIIIKNAVKYSDFISKSTHPSQQNSK